MADPSKFWWFLGLIAAMIIFSIGAFAHTGKTGWEQLNFYILPLIFIASLTLYSSFIANKYVIHFLYLLGSIFLFNYLKISYGSLALNGQEQQRSLLENISSYGNFLTFFFASASLYALKPLLGVSIWLPAVTIIAVVILVLRQNVWVNKFAFKEGMVYLIILTLILLEIAATLYWLPLNYNSVGLVLTICYYIIIGLSRNHLRKSLNSRNIKLYLAIGFSSILLVLFTSKWT